jgi:dihydrofolate synthase/folylpolyglutamate synthase
VGIRSDVTVFGVLRDKDYGKMLSALSGVSRTFVFTKPSSNRALPLSRLKVAGRDRGIGTRGLASVGQALDLALSRAERDGTVLVCGSIYTIGEAMQALGYRPEAARLH